MSETDAGRIKVDRNMRAMLIMGAVVGLVGLMIPVIIFACKSLLTMTAGASIGQAAGVSAGLIGGSIATGGILPAVLIGAAVFAAAGGGLYMGMKNYLQPTRAQITRKQPDTYVGLMPKLGQGVKAEQARVSIVLEKPQQKSRFSLSNLFARVWRSKQSSDIDSTPENTTRLPSHTY